MSIARSKLEGKRPVGVECLEAIIPAVSHDDHALLGAGLSMGLAAGAVPSGSQGHNLTNMVIGGG